VGSERERNEEVAKILSRNEEQATMSSASSV
jgi:hypothetical protein